MQKYNILLLAIIILLFSSCQKPVKKFKSTQYIPTSKNFSFLNEALKDVKILAIGESSHGFGSMQMMKGDLVKYLHEELDFDVLVMEAGFADIGTAWKFAEMSTAKQMINGTLPLNLRSEQMLPLFEYIFEKNETEDPLALEGMDPRISGFAFKYKLMYVIGRLEPKIIQDSIQSGLADFNKTFDVLDNREQWQKYKDSYLGAIDLSKAILLDSKEDIMDMELAEEGEYKILLKYLDMLVELVDYNFGETYSKGLGIRDSLMAENVAFFINKYPKAKIIIWGHNGHIEKGPGEGDNIKWLGHYLKERYKDDYYAMGMYAKKGFIYQTAERKISNFDIVDPSFIEAKIDEDYGKNVFLDLPLFDETNTNWINKPINGYELEAGGKVSFIPAKRFDGVILLGETEAPKYMVESATRR